MLAGIAISFGYAAMPALIAASVPLRPDRHRQRHQLHLPVGGQLDRQRGGHLVARSKTVTYASAGVALPAESQFTLSFVIAAGALLLAAAVALLGLSKHHRRSPRPSRWPKQPVEAAEAAPESSDAHDETLPAVAETSAEQRQPWPVHLPGSRRC